jgi:glycyl-tRNA synthetase beta subunit
VLEHPITMDLPAALQQAITLLPSHLVSEPEALGARLLGYILQRLRSHCLDKGLRPDAIAAALAIPRGDLTLLYAAAQALHAWCGTPQGQQVVMLYRRAANLLRQAGPAHLDDRQPVAHSHS